MIKRVKIENSFKFNELKESKLVRNRFKDNNYYFFDEIDNTSNNQKLGKLR